VQPRSRSSYMHPFSIDSLPRGPKGHEHVERYYEAFEQIKGGRPRRADHHRANVTGTDLSREPFWEPLIEVFDWAVENVPRSCARASRRTR